MGFRCFLLCFLLTFVSEIILTVQALAWEYNQKVSSSLSSTAQFKGIVQLSTSRTAFAQISSHLEFSIHRWSSSANLPACGPSATTSKCTTDPKNSEYFNSPCGANIAGTCPTNGNWNEEIHVTVDFSLESASLSDCSIKKVTITKTVTKVTNDVCATKFPDTKQCRFETGKIHYVNGKVQTSSITNSIEKINMENMLTAGGTLNDKASSFQINLETLTTSSLGKYLEQNSVTTNIPDYKSMFESLGLSSTITVTLDHFWSTGMMMSDTGSSLHIQFEWGLKATKSQYLSSASGDTDLMGLLSSKKDGITPCFGNFEAPGNFCVITSPVPLGVTWKAASKCTIGKISENVKGDDGTIKGDGCAERRRLRLLLNNEKTLCKDNGVQYYNLHENECTPEGQDIYSNKKSERLSCCGGINACWEPRSQRGIDAYKQKHGKEKTVPEKVQVCRKSCCENNKLGAGKCTSIATSNKRGVSCVGFFVLSAIIVLFV
jgi:hypothetical protein